MHERVLIALTSHDKLGDTGAPTGAYLSEIAHPYAVFTQAGYEVELPASAVAACRSTASIAPTRPARRS